jgi:thymidylate kinase
MQPSRVIGVRFTLFEHRLPARFTARLEMEGRTGAVAMRSTSSRHQVAPLTALAADARQSGLGRILLGVFEMLDRAGIPYCVLHGYESYPQLIKSDVDCIISAEFGPDQLLALLHKNSARVGAHVVRRWDHHLTLAGKNSDGSPCFLVLDLSELNDRLFYAVSDVLESRRRHHQFWIPAANLEFGNYLVKRITEGRLDDERARRLSGLYRQDVAGCKQQVARFWGARSTALILLAAGSGDWEPVRRRLPELRAELRRRATVRNPGRVVGKRLRGYMSRIRRCWRLDGLNVVFLGPDGAGKSSVIQAAGPMLAGAFRRTTCYSFPPALLGRLLHRPDRPDILPHALQPRPFLISAMRAVFYWFAYYTFGYGAVHLALARNTLVLHDRHLVDALVDPRRYRYAGPLWLLRLLWRLIPKPDLIILLDAPPGVVQARKQEVPFEETARQREAYLSLVGTMRNGHVVDAARPLDHVVGAVNDIILRHLAARITRRLELEQDARCQQREAQGQNLARDCGITSSETPRSTSNASR